MGQHGIMNIIGDATYLQPMAVAFERLESRTVLTYIQGNPRPINSVSLHMESGVNARNGRSEVYTQHSVISQ